MKPTEVFESLENIKEIKSKASVNTTMARLVDKGLLEKDGTSYKLMKKEVIGIPAPTVQIESDKVASFVKSKVSFI